MKIARTAYSPITVIGMSCRLPKAPGPDAFWRLSRDGVSAITDTPADRWGAAQPQQIGIRLRP